MKHEVKTNPNISLRLNGLEFRSCSDNRFEIIQWEVNNEKKEYCYSVAYWEESSEGHELRFVGNRPFKVNLEDFMFIAKFGQSYLDKGYAEWKH